MLNIAIRAARAGGRVLTQSMNRIETIRVEAKGKNDLVSEIDRATEAEIINTLQRSYPDHHFVCEESGEIGPAESEYQWFIDPLDGTKNFLHGYPAFCVSIAVAKDNRLDQAVIYNPISQELFTGSRGAGATLDGKRIRVAKLNGLDNALLSSGYANDGKSDFEAYLKTLATFTDRTSAVRRQGSAALDLAYVAAGRLDGYWQFGLKKWDTAAGALIVREAGGLIGDMSGDAQWFESGNVVAASPRVFDAMIRTFREINVKEI